MADFNDLQFLRAIMAHGRNQEGDAQLPRRCSTLLLLSRYYVLAHSKIRRGTGYSMPAALFIRPGPVMLSPLPSRAPSPY